MSCPIALKMGGFIQRKSGGGLVLYKSFECHDNLPPSLWSPIQNPVWSSIANRMVDPNAARQPAFHAG